MPSDSWRSKPIEPGDPLPAGRPAVDREGGQTPLGGLRLVREEGGRVGLLDATDVRPEGPRRSEVHVVIPEMAEGPDLLGVSALLDPAFLAEVAFDLAKTRAPGALVWQGDRLIGVLSWDAVIRTVPDDVRRQIQQTSVGGLPGLPHPKPPSFTCDSCGHKVRAAPGKGAPTKCPSCGGTVSQDP